MASTTASAASPARPLTGWHVLMMIGGFFGLIIAANTWFMMQAIGTYSGDLGRNSYRTGLDYNTRIAAGARQEALHWKTTLALTPSGRTEFLVTDAAGQPVKGLSVVALVGRPATARSDHKLKLTETAPGHYSAEGGALAEGAYVIDVEARQASDASGEPTYRERRRVWLKS